MNELSCVRTAENLLREADERFAPLLAGIPEYREAFLTVCACLDKVMEACEATEYGITVDEETTDITVSFVCPYLEKYGCEEELVAALATANKVTVRAIPDTPDALEILFVFPGIWGYAE